MRVFKLGFYNSIAYLHKQHNTQLPNIKEIFYVKV